MRIKVSSPKILNIIVCVVLLIAFVLLIGTKLQVNAQTIESTTDEVLPSNQLTLISNYPELTLLQNDEVVVSDTDEEEPVIVYNMDYYIEEYSNTINFFAKAFGYNSDDVITNLKELEAKNTEVYETNIGYLTDANGNIKVYDNFTYGLIEYFYSLTKSNELTRSKKYVAYTGTADYVEKLIMYYSTIYTNTDVSTLLSIGAAESGYYKVTYMLKKNNIYGGMSNSGLIKYNNIELGVLTYVRMMSKNYYGKGLTTINSIGRVYCPVYVDGSKMASPHWVSLVNKAKAKYDNYTNVITIDSLTSEAEIM